MKVSSVITSPKIENSENYHCLNMKETSTFNLPPIQPTPTKNITSSHTSINTTSTSIITTTTNTNTQTNEISPSVPPPLIQQLDSESTILNSSLSYKSETNVLAPSSSLPITPSEATPTIIASCLF
ncbi:unnamed protein product [Cunninghamella blakesleeana]